ncbi:PIR protein [Plasmodium vivax]|nr:PIR protein [Plasmodium vivax]
MGDSIYLKGLDWDLKILSNGLPSENFYNTLSHNTIGLNNYENKCNSIFSKKSSFYNKRLCTILLRYLETSSKRSQAHNSAYDNCILFNYWIYGELARKYAYKYYAKVIPAFGEYNRIWNELIEDESNVAYHDKCKPDFDIAKQDDWEKRKELYDYCVNTKTLIETANNYEKTCKDIYAYIKGKTHLYERFKTQCIPEDKNKCPKFYSKCIDYHPDKVLHQLTCHKDMKEEEASLPAAAGDLPEKALQDLSSSPTFSLESSQLKGDGTHPATKTGDILLGVVATSLTSGALYRFTPLGRIIRNGLGWNNNNMRNMHGSEYGLFDYAPESFNPYTGGGEEHYIGYQPA